MPSSMRRPASRWMEGVVMESSCTEVQSFYLTTAVEIAQPLAGGNQVTLGALKGEKLVQGERQRMSIRNWPEGERPREKLLALGAEALSDAELLAIFLRSEERRVGKEGKVGGVR